MDATNAMSFVAALRPPSGTAALSAYIDAAVRALGGRADADLARTMSVPDATVASWKRRGLVPEGSFMWFTTTLAEKIAEYRIDLPQAGFTARAVVLRLILLRHGDVLGIEQGTAATAYALGGLLALAQFLDEVADLPSEAARVDALADLLAGGMWEFQHGVRLPIRPRSEGPQ